MFRIGFITFNKQQICRTAQFTHPRVLCGHSAFKSFVMAFRKIVIFFCGTLTWIIRFKLSLFLLIHNWFINLQCFTRNHCINLNRREQEYKAILCRLYSKANSTESYFNLFISFVAFVKQRNISIIKQNDIPLLFLLLILLLLFLLLMVVDVVVLSTSSSGTSTKRRY